MKSQRLTPSAEKKSVCFFHEKYNDKKCGKYRDERTQEQTQLDDFFPPSNLSALQMRLRGLVLITFDRLAHRLDTIG